MMKRLPVMGLFMGLAVIATPASAGCRIVHRCAPPVVVQSVPVVEVAAVPVVPVVSAFLPAAVVAYGAAYAPGTVYPGAVQGAQQGYAQQPGQQDAVLAALQRLEQRLGAMEQRAGVAPPQQQTAPMPQADAPQEQTPPAQQQANGGADVLKLFTARCASCHQKGREGSGGGFVLLDGPRLAGLSAAKQKEVLQRVYSADPKKSMPRGGKALTDEELSVVISWLATN